MRAISVGFHEADGCLRIDEEQEDSVVNQFEFTLRFVLPSPDVDIEGYVERLGTAGCNDAAFGIGHEGRIALSFSREASSAETAVLSGIADVRRAIPDASLIEASL